MNGVQNIVAKSEMAHYEQYFFGHNVFKGHLLQRCQKASVYRKWLSQFFYMSFFHILNTFPLTDASTADNF